MKNIMIGRAYDVFKILSDNPYSALWDLTEDFSVNGHTVSVKRSTQYKHVIIDGRYESISENYVMSSQGKDYKGLDWVMHLLEV